jgi:multiple sugar transport system permease protein
LRDICAATTVAIFMFPVFWAALDSIKPTSAVYDKDGIVWTFTPTLENYATVFGQGEGVFDGRAAIMASVVVAFGAMLLALAFSVPASFAIWRLAPNRQRWMSLAAWLGWVLPPALLISPIFLVYHAVGLFDTLPGLILAEAALHLPFALLLLSSFFSEIPRDIADAATIDGATEWQVFHRVVVPVLHGAIATTGILLLIFCWTEFFMAVFLSAFIRLVPVQIANLSNAMGGSSMAMSTAAIVPAFVFVLFVQKHLARALTLGLEKN